MNKETIVIKNYVLSTDMVYLNYENKEEDCHRRYCKEAVISDTKIKDINSFKENGSCL